MATSVFACGMECGVAGTAVGQHVSTLTNASFSTSTVHSGLRSLRINPTAGQGRARLEVGLTGAVVVWYYYLNVASNPSVTMANGICASDGGNSHYLGLGFNTADSLWYPCDDTGAAITLGSQGVSLSAGWHLIDCRVSVAANPWTIDVAVDGVALTQLTRAIALTTLNLQLECGNGLAPQRATVTFDLYVDTVKVSLTSGDYPLGGGTIEGFVPNADGTHTSTGSNITKGTAATPVGTAITSATTDAFNWVNARPIGGGATDATRLINQRLVATEYAEVDFEPASAAPRAVEVITADQQATTAAGGFSTKLNDNGTEDVIITRSAAGVVTDRFATKHYATMVGGGAWTLARFNALKARFGYSGDATPDQYWRGIMIEAEFAPAAAGIPNKQLFVNPAAVNRAAAW